MIWIIVAFWFGGAVVSLLRDGFKFKDPSDSVVNLGSSTFGPDPSDPHAVASFNTALAATLSFIRKHHFAFNITSAILWPISEAITAVVVPRMNHTAHAQYEAIHRAGQPKMCSVCKDSFERGMRAHEEWHEMNRACRDCQNLFKRWQNGDEDARAESSGPYDQAATGGGESVVDLPAEPGA